MLKGCYDGVGTPKQVNVRRLNQGLARSARRSSLTRDLYTPLDTPRAPKAEGEGGGWLVDLT